MKTVLIIVAVVFFALDFFRVPAPVSWTPGGYACLAAALFLL
jgi:hypothetical protein